MAGPVIHIDIYADVYVYKHVKPILYCELITLRLVVLVLGCCRWCCWWGPCWVLLLVSSTGGYLVTRPRTLYTNSTLQTFTKTKLSRIKNTKARLVFSLWIQFNYFVEYWNCHYLSMASMVLIFWRLTGYLMGIIQNGTYKVLKNITISDDAGIM